MNIILEMMPGFCHCPYSPVPSHGLVPDLDLAGPVAGGRSRGEDGMLRNTQAGLAVGAQSV